MTTKDPEDFDAVLAAYYRAKATAAEPLPEGADDAIGDQRCDALIDAECAIVMTPAPHLEALAEKFTILERDLTMTHIVGTRLDFPLSLLNSIKVDAIRLLKKDA